MSVQNTLALRRWATPLTIVTSVLVGISGVMMFFHLGEGLIKGMHEWIGLLMVAAVVTHIVVHVKPFKRHFSQRAALSVMFAVLLVSGSLLDFGDGGGSPVMAVIHSVEAAPVSMLAELQQVSPQVLLDKLAAAGYESVSLDMSINVLAEQHQMHPKELLGIVYAK